MNYTHQTSDFTPHTFDRDNSVKSLDFVQLLTADYNLLIAQEAKTEKPSYLRLLKGLRRIIQT